MSNNSSVLAINSGSSSLKVALIQKDGTHSMTFLAERLGTEKASIRIKKREEGESTTSKAIPECTHEQALEHILKLLSEQQLLDTLVATGHRVVHGGATFTASAVVDDQTLRSIQAISHLAPLHNPHNVAGIQAVQTLLPQLPVVAVFDTSFHSTLPAKASLYPLPAPYRERGIRKYGFHGTSVRYVTDRAVEVLRTLLLQRPQESYNLIVCHLGNGASVTAVADKASVETSMGFSPLEGLMMGTRSGSIDPAIVSFAVHAFDKSVDDVLVDLNKESGLKAMAPNHGSDMRSILQQAAEGSEEAQLAVDMFNYRVVQHIASCLVALPGLVDAIVFTGGIGEHSGKIRRACIEQLQRSILPSLRIDDDRNKADGSKSNGVLSIDGCWPVCLDIATDEEAMIARDCFELLNH